MREHNRTLLDVYENTFSTLYSHFWRKLSIGRQGVFELMRLIEHRDIYAIKFLKFHLIIGLFESRSGLIFQALLSLLLN